jgi:hypothetical protein
MNIHHVILYVLRLLRSIKKLFDEMDYSHIIFNDIRSVL